MPTTSPSPRPADRRARRRRLPARRALVAGALALTLTGGAAVTAVAGGRTPAPPSRGAVQNLPAGSANPMIANGTTIGPLVTTYKSSGTGPGRLNPAGAAGTPESYVDASFFPGGTLPAGVTITEAQGLNALARIEANLASVGLGLDDVITMRVFVDAPPGAAVADYAGFNRAYRQYFANVDLVSGATLAQPVGTAAPTPPLVVNAQRPSRSLMEVASLPVAGWLVEIEVDAVVGRR